MFPGHDMHSLEYAPSPGVTLVVCLRGLLHQHHSFPRAASTSDSYPRVDRSVDILTWGQGRLPLRGSPRGISQHRLTSLMCSKLLSASRVPRDARHAMRYIELEIR